MKRIVILLLSAVVLFGCATVYRDSEGNIVPREKMEVLKAAAVKGYLTEKRFRIFVDKIYPMGMSVRTLNEDYVIEVSRDSIGMVLPYVGRLDRAPIDGRVGIEVLSPIYSYTSEPIKNGERILIETRDQTETYLIVLNIYDDGSANINLKSNIRAAIGYSGMMQLNDRFVPKHIK